MKQARREIADLIFTHHSDINRAISCAVQTVMDGGDVKPAIHLMQTAIDLSAREMRSKITKTLEAAE